jgi:oligoribonuclease
LHGVLVWMDLEMTGLEPETDVIVEIATLITDDDLNIIAEGPDLVIHQSDEVLARMNQIVVDMHTKSGLLEAIKSSTITLEEAGAATLEFIRQHIPEARTIPLCGNSIGTDRRFLAKYLPEIENYLHYRSVDVSTIKELARRWYPKLGADRPNKGGTHRALDDIRASVNELAFYRERVFTPLKPEQPNYCGQRCPSQRSPSRNKFRQRMKSPKLRQASTAPNCPSICLALAT